MIFAVLLPYLFKRRNRSAGSFQKNQGISSGQPASPGDTFPLTVRAAEKMIGSGLPAIPMVVFSLTQTGMSL